MCACGGDPVGDTTAATPATGTPGQPDDATSSGGPGDHDVDPTDGPEPTTGDLPPRCDDCDTDGSCEVALCGVVENDTDGSATSGGPTEEELDCALAALRDRTPGVVRWHFGAYGDQFEISGSSKILADGSAWRESGGKEDLCSYSSDTSRWLLPAASYFEACLALASYGEKFACLSDWDSPGMELEVCGEAWQDCDDGV